MEEYFKPRGATRGSKPDAGNANIRSVPVFAVVKDNIDPIRSGRLRVYIADFSGDDPNNADSWVTVAYMTPFYGRTNGNPPNTGFGSYKNNPHSYGMWTSPPDIGTTVICIFVNGDPNFGFWIGCVPDPDALHMVPAIGASSKIIANESEANSYGGSTLLPVTNINPNDAAISETSKFLEATKPVHSYSAYVYAQQGLIRDNIRGPLTTSAQRETPSRVGFGISTPGRPIYEGGFTDENIVDNLTTRSPEKFKVIGRRGGHTFIMDDGDLIGNDKLMRLRTTLGHQILLSDSGQCLHIIHANGQSWIELGKEGTIDMYSTNSVNIRTQGDLNLHADNNINLHAVKDLAIQAENIKINSEKNIQMKAGADFSGYTMGKYTWKVDGAMAMSAGGEGSYAAGGTMFVNGSKVNLNTGKASVVPAAVPPLTTFAHTDTLYDSVKGFAAAPGKLISITSRAPAHAPWANAGQGVNVQTKLNAEDNLPKPASPAVEATNASASAATPPTPTVTTIATVPPAPPISTTLNTNVTTGLLSAQATAAATGAAAQATKTGVAIITENGVSEAFIGSFAMTSKQMQDGGYLLPGSSDKINANIMSGMAPDKAFDPAFFTGKDGVRSLADFNKKTSAQITAQVTNYQKVQKELQASSTITGNESPQQIAGVVAAGVQAGTNSVIDAVKKISGNIVGDLTTKLNSVKDALGVGDKLTNAITSGNLAAGLTTKITSGLSGISTSLTGMKGIPGLSSIIENTKTVSAAAFGAITAALKPFKAFEPVNLFEEAKKNATELEGAAAGFVDPTNNLANKVPGIALKQLGDAAGRASGINNLPGGQKAVDAVVDSAGKVVGASTGALTAAKSQIDQLSTSVSNGVSLDSVSKIAGDGLKLASNIGLPKLSNPLAGGAAGLLANFGGDLAKNALKGLPPGVASQLQSAISSIGSGGSVSIKLPEVAEGTTDRSSLESSAKNLLGDPGIPLPNYGSTALDPVAYQASLKSKSDQLRQETQSKMDQIKQGMQKFSEQSKIVDKAYAELKQAENSLPPGDPKIQELKVAYLSEVKRLTEISDENQRVRQILTA